MKRDFDHAYNLWTYLHSAILLLSVLLLTPLLIVPDSLLFWFLAPYTVLVLLRLYSYGGWRSGSLADVVTASRGVAAVFLFLWAASVNGFPSLVGEPARWTLLALLALTELTDFFDGRVARKRGSRPFGAVWDMENDALFIFALALVGRAHLDFPVWALLMGVMRYLYFLLFRITGDPPGYPGAYKWFAKSVAALIAVSLVVAYLPSIGGRGIRLLLGPVLLLQLLSFGWDLGLQIRAGRVRLLFHGSEKLPSRMET